jgi:hypothetical protein
VADHDAGVDLGFVVAQADVPNERQHLGLVVDGDVEVPVIGSLEIGQPARRRTRSMQPSHSSSWCGLLRVVAHWRVLFPALRGPPPDDERIAPYANYFTDPFVDLIARRLHTSERAAAAVSRVALAVVIAGLGRASSAR